MVLGPKLASEIVRLLKKCAVWLQQKIGANDLAEFFLAHFIEPLNLLSRQAAHLLHQLLLSIAHRHVLWHVTSIYIDVNVNIAVIDEHCLVGRTCRLRLVGNHLRVLL